MLLEGKKLIANNSLWIAAPLGKKKEFSVSLHRSSELLSDCAVKHIEEPSYKEYMNAHMKISGVSTWIDLNVNKRNGGRLPEIIISDYLEAVDMLK